MHGVHTKESVSARHGGPVAPGKETLIIAERPCSVDGNEIEMDPDRRDKVPDGLHGKR